MPNWKNICKLEDIPKLGSRRVTGATVIPIAIFRTSEDKVFALEDKCPHKGGPLSQGIVHGGSVACPLHNWNISLGTGCAAAPDEGCVVRYETQVVDGVVMLAI